MVQRGAWNGKQVAVKYMAKDARDRIFRREMRQLSRVDHPNIIKLHGVIQEANRWGLVMECAEGGSLHQGAVQNRILTNKYSLT